MARSRGPENWVGSSGSDQRLAAGSSPNAHVKHEKYRALVDFCSGLEAEPCAVVHPCDSSSLAGAVRAGELNLIRPILVGPRARIEAVARENGLNIEGLELIDTAHSHASADCGAALVRDGRARMLMKGSLHTDELLAVVVSREGGLRTERRISHCFVMDVPVLDRVVIISDAAVNIFPSLAEKVDIVQNAIDLAHALGNPLPLVAILSATESVNAKIQSTLDAAALCKMADRGQITGGLLDGPLALDNAVDLNAAKIKQIDSPVAGRADILIAPDLEAGNMLAKSLSFMADADAAGIILGARVPIILTSRADGLETRLASSAIAALLVRYQDQRAQELLATVALGKSG
jgi:phosphate acetyltransferase